MTPLDTLRAIAADPHGRPMTARETIEARLGVKLPPDDDLPPDLSTAIDMLDAENTKRNAP